MLATSIPCMYPKAEFPSAWLQTEGESVMRCPKGPPYAKRKSDKEFIWWQAYLLRPPRCLPCPLTTLSRKRSSITISSSLVTCTTLGALFSNLISVTTEKGRKWSPGRRQRGLWDLKFITPPQHPCSIPALPTSPGSASPRNITVGLLFHLLIATG